MTESEQLKKNTDEQKAKQVVDELGAYLDLLGYNLKRSIKRHMVSSVIYLIAWMGWILGGFFFWGNWIFTPIFIVALINDQVCFAMMQKAQGEFRGCIETLRILGYIDPNAGKGESSKEKGVWEKGAEIVRGWMTKKEKSQSEVFKTA